MAATPEAKVKQKVRDILDRYSRMYYYMPVPTGYGQTSLDFIGCYNGLFFSIETKTEGKVPTARQNVTIAEMLDAHAEVFVITGVTDVEAFGRLVDWLERNRPTSHDSAHQPRTQSGRRTVPI